MHALVMWHHVGTGATVPVRAIHAPGLMEAKSLNRNVWEPFLKDSKLLWREFQIGRATTMLLMQEVGGVDWL